MLGVVLKQSKVVWSVIKSQSILVIHHFSPEKNPTKQTLHHEAMSSNPLHHVRSSWVVAQM